MKLVIDVNLSPRWVQFLNEAGHDAAHWQALGPMNASDDAVLATARQLQAVVVTHDVGFGRLLAIARFTGPSVVLLRMARPVPKADSGLLKEVPALHRAAIESDCLLVVEPPRVRL